MIRPQNPQSIQTSVNKFWLLGLGHFPTPSFVQQVAGKFQIVTAVYQHCFLHRWGPPVVAHEVGADDGVVNVVEMQCAVFGVEYLAVGHGDVA